MLALPLDSAYACSGVTRVVINAGDLDDSLTAADALAVPLTINGESGDDNLRGGAAGDTLAGKGGTCRSGAARSPRASAAAR